MNIPFQEGSYTYTLKVGGKLCLLVSVRSLRLLRTKCKNHPSPTSCELSIFKFITTFIAYFTLGKAHGWAPLQTTGPNSATTSLQAPYIGNDPILELFLPYTQIYSYIKAGVHPDLAIPYLRAFVLSQCFHSHLNQSRTLWLRHVRMQFRRTPKTLVHYFLWKQMLTRDQCFVSSISE